MTIKRIDLRHCDFPNAASVRDRLEQELIAIHIRGENPSEYKVVLSESLALKLSKMQDARKHYEFPCMERTLMGLPVEIDA